MFNLSKYNNVSVANYKPGSQIVFNQLPAKAGDKNITDLALSGNSPEQAVDALNRPDVPDGIKIKTLEANLKHPIFINSEAMKKVSLPLLHHVCLQNMTLTSLVCRNIDLAVRLDNNRLLANLLNLHHQFLTTDFADHRSNLPRPPRWVYERLH